jgi:hypothetical protein
MQSQVGYGKKNKIHICECRTGSMGSWPPPMRTRASLSLFLIVAGNVSFRLCLVVVLGFHMLINI